MPRKNGERQGGAEPYSVVVSADAEPERWLQERRKLLTATDIPSVLGIPGARSALETWYQKKDALVARSESDAIREAKAAGHEFEDFNALMFAKAAGRFVERSQQLLRSARHPWLGCTLDYEQTIKDRPPHPAMQRTQRYLRAPVETKNAGSHAADDMWPLGGEPHLTWQTQVIVQCIVMDVPVGSLSAWLGSPFVHHRWCDIERDKELETLILEEGRRFWRSLSRKQPPKTEPSAASFEVLRRLSPSRATGKVISLPKSLVDSDRLTQKLEVIYASAKESTDSIKARLDHERAKFADAIGEHAGGKLPGGTVWTFKHVHVPAHNVATYSYRKLERVSAKASKPRRVTWKTSR